MASYHINISTGAKGKALEHAQYIGREGPFTEERYGEIEARGHGNMPEWARDDTAAFWRASDEHERANGNTYREYELALPRELEPAARVALVEQFAEQELGSARPYQWAIHNGLARDGKEQPHVHLMFSDRQQDGIERGPEQFFKRFNSQHPERGGAQKFSYGATRQEAALAYEGIRERWANVQNQALEHAGMEARVDHRSLADQGIEREPEVHRGPAVSAIEARGQVSEVGERQREQMLERTEAREQAAAEVTLVTRQEMAAERVAMRERRELAQEVTGEDRAVVLAAVEVDRRQQLEHAQAAAERRIERRQALSIQQRLKERLLTQAQALRQRLGQELTRVKEWVQERFIEPLRRVKEKVMERVQGQEKASLDLVALKARGREAAQGWRRDLHERQQTLEREAREKLLREKTVEQFQELVAGRSRGRSGFTDRSPEWQQTPEALKAAVDQFKELAPSAQKRALARLAQEPQQVLALQQLMDQRRQRVHSLDHGQEM